MKIESSEVLRRYLLKHAPIELKFPDGSFFRCTQDNQMFQHLCNGVDKVCTNPEVCDKHDVLCPYTAVKT